MCFCVYLCEKEGERYESVCMCVRERERKREKEGEKEKERERERVIEKESNLNLIDRCNEAKMKTKQNIFLLNNKIENNER